jgi:putative transposase
VRSRRTITTPGAAWPAYICRYTGGAPPAPAQWRARGSSHDLLAYEPLQIRNLVRNHRLAKSIADAAWGRLLLGLLYNAKLHAIRVIAVPPRYTTQACSTCGRLVSTSLSSRTHVAPRCGPILDRDQNAARNILVLAVGGGKLTLALALAPTPTTARTKSLYGRADRNSLGLS